MDFQIPPGFWFTPNDQELVGFLHRMLVLREPQMPFYNSIIHSCDLYGTSLEPSEIWNNYGGDTRCLHEDDLPAIYFYSHIKTKPKSRKVERTIGHAGTWSEGVGFKEIRERGNSKPIGRKRSFRFENGKSTNEHGGWFLDEYSLFRSKMMVAEATEETENSAVKKRKRGGCGGGGAAAYDFDVVLCRMRRNGRRKQVDDRDHSNSNSSSVKPSLEDESRAKNKKMKIDKDRHHQQEDVHDHLALISATVPTPAPSAVVDKFHTEIFVADEFDREMSVADKYGTEILFSPGEFAFPETWHSCNTAELQQDKAGDGCSPSTTTPTATATDEGMVDTNSGFSPAEQGVQQNQLSYVCSPSTSTAATYDGNAVINTVEEQCIGESLARLQAEPGLDITPISTLEEENYNRWLTSLMDDDSVKGFLF